LALGMNLELKLGLTLRWVLAQAGTDLETEVETRIVCLVCPAQTH
jgi:hypothetical protein